MSEPPQFPPNPDEPRHDPPNSGQYPPSGSWLGESPPPSSQPQHPYAPPPAFGSPGQYGAPMPNPYGPGPGEQYPAGYPAPAPRIRPSELVGARSRQRPGARTTIALAGIGAVLLVLGIGVWATGYFVEGVDVSFFGSSSASSDDGRRFLGAGLFAAAILLGYLLVIRLKRGPLATAGTVLSALSVPLFLVFITLSVEDTFRSGEYPFDFDLVYVLSIVVWLATYLFVPGARGRSLYLGAAALGFSNYVAFKAAGADSLRSAVATGPAGALGGASDSGVAAAGIILGLVYYGIAVFLDRRGRHGAATPMALAAFFTTIGGIAAGVPDFEVGGTGAVLLVLGVVLCLYGGWSGRRFTTWAWAGATLVGIFLIVVEIIGEDSDSYTAFGIAFILVGAAVAAVAQVLHSALNEPPDIDETPPLPPTAQPMPYGYPHPHGPQPY